MNYDAWVLKCSDLEDKELQRAFLANPPGEFVREQVLGHVLVCDHCYNRYVLDKEGEFEDAAMGFFLRRFTGKEDVFEDFRYVVSLLIGGKRFEEIAEEIEELAARVLKELSEEINVSYTSPAQFLAKSLSAPPITGEVGMSKLKVREIRVEVETIHEKEREFPVESACINEGRLELTSKELKDFLEKRRKEKYLLVDMKRHIYTNTELKEAKGEVVRFELAKKKEKKELKGLDLVLYLVKEGAKE